MKQDILIAESNVELRDIFQRFLNERGFAATTASDGLECLEQLRRCCPAVLVLDRELRWGGADGVLACLREEGMSGIAVVLTGTSGSSSFTVDYLVPPVAGFLPKPFGQKALLESVQAALAEIAREAPSSKRTRPADDFEQFIG